MRNDEIHRLFEQQDKNLKGYVDMKIRAVMKKIAPWPWIKSHPWKSAIVLILIISAGIWVSHRISVQQVFEKVTGIELNEHDHK